MASFSSKLAIIFSIENLMNHRGQLAISIALSIATHILIISGFVENTAPVISSKRIDVSLMPIAINIPTKDHRHIVREQKPEKLPSPELPAGLANTPEVHPGNRIVLGSNSLDTALELTNELDLERLENYPAGVTGHAELSILIADDGSVRWISVEQSDLTGAALQVLLEKFKKAEFSRPIAGGSPTWVLIRIEVNIGSGL